MAHPGTIFQKSAKGSQAISTRDHALSPRQRSLLIMVDGKKTLEQLIKLGATTGTPAQELLQQLHEQGYIEPSGAAVAAAPASSAGSAPSAGPGAGVPLKEAQRYAVRRLTDLLGPTGEDLCMRIESTRNTQDFMQVLKRAESVVRNVKGDEKASRFLDDMQGHLPA